MPGRLRRINPGRYPSFPRCTGDVKGVPHLMHRRLVSDELDHGHSRLPAHIADRRADGGLFLAGKASHAPRLGSRCHRRRDWMEYALPVAHRGYICRIHRRGGYPHHRLWCAPDTTAAEKERRSGQHIALHGHRVRRSPSTGDHHRLAHGLFPRSRRRLWDARGRRRTPARRSGFSSPDRRSIHPDR